MQDTSRDFSTISDEVDGCIASGIAYNTFGNIPFTDIITGLEVISADEKFVFRAGVKVIGIFDRLFDLRDIGFPENDEKLLRSLKNGIWHSSNLDQENYSWFDLPLLNKGSRFAGFDEVADERFDRLMFIKPSEDLKVFAGGILEVGQSPREFIESVYHFANYDESVILLSEYIGNIECEARFFCIHDEVIDGSYYKINGAVKHMVLENDSAIMRVAREYAKLYQPELVYAMDIARLGDGSYRIVEYNCFNGSGMYKVDIARVFKEVAML